MTPTTYLAKLITFKTNQPSNQRTVKSWVYKNTERRWVVITVREDKLYLVWIPWHYGGLLDIPIKWVAEAFGYFFLVLSLSCALIIKQIIENNTTQELKSNESCLISVGPFRCCHVWIAKSRPSNGIGFAPPRISMDPTGSGYSHLLWYGF